MTEWTVKVFPFPNWNGYGEPPIWHVLCQACNAAAAESQARMVTYEGRRMVPEGAIVKAYLRYM